METRVTARIRKLVAARYQEGPFAWASLFGHRGDDVACCSQCLNHIRKRRGIRRKEMLPMDHFLLSLLNPCLIARVRAEHARAIKLIFWNYQTKRSVLFGGACVRARVPRALHAAPYQTRTPTCAPFMRSVSPSSRRTYSWPAAFAASARKAIYAQYDTQRFHRCIARSKPRVNRPMKRVTPLWPCKRHQRHIWLGSLMTRIHAPSSRRTCSWPAAFAASARKTI